MKRKSGSSLIYCCRLIKGVFCHQLPLSVIFGTIIISLKSKRLHLITALNTGRISNIYSSGMTGPSNEKKDVAKKKTSPPLKKNTIKQIKAVVLLSDLDFRIKQIKRNSIVLFGFILHFPCNISFFVLGTKRKQSQGFQKNCSLHNKHLVSHEHRKLLACKSASDNYQSRFTAILAQRLSFRPRWSLESCLTRADSLVENLLNSHFYSTFPCFPAVFPNSAVLPFGRQGRT